MADEESCPAIGVFGIHSEEYYEGGRCMWCGAKKEDKETDGEEE